MKTKIPILLALVLGARAAQAQIPVTDAGVLGHLAEEIALVKQQLDLFRAELQRLGDPAGVGAKVAPALMQTLGLGGVGQTGFELRTSATGAAGVAYDGDGLFQPPGEVITTGDGRQFDRPLDEYKPFDAVTRARAALENVMHDTEERRQALRGQIQSTVAQLQAAPTLAEVQKLQGVLTAQNAELGAIDREREAALGRVLVQNIENQTDAARQEQAREEERQAEFRAASEQFGRLLRPDPRPIVIPDPRQSLP